MCIKFSIFFTLVTAIVLCVESSNTSCPNVLGRDGRDGLPGRDGRNGRDGLTIVGPPGRDGADGHDCVECARGPRGAKGETGKPGVNGIPGSKGATGLTGIQGAKGDRGLVGPAGNVGKKGEKGDKGVCDEATLKKMTDEITLLKQKLSLILDANNVIRHHRLPGGYGKYTASDLQWQSLHMAAAAACRGSTATGGGGPHANIVYPRRPNMTCDATCKQNKAICDEELTITGKVGKETKASEVAGYFYNYKCNTYKWSNDESSVSNEGVTAGMVYTSYCCCRRLQ